MKRKGIYIILLSIYSICSNFCCRESVDTIDEDNKRIEDESKREDEQKKELIKEIRSLDSKIGGKDKYSDFTDLSKDKLSRILEGKKKKT